MLNVLLLSTLFIIVYSKDYKAVDSLDINKYIGTWYQVYQDKFDQLFQGVGTCSTAKYSLIEDNKISVFNQQINSQNQTESIEGYAYYKDNDCCGYLTVHFSNNIPEAPYWVIELGPVESNLYDYSIVSDNKRHSLYVLTRNVERFYQKYNETVISSLQEFGFTQIFNTPFIMEQKNCINL
jgi:lipocalin